MTKRPNKISAAPKVVPPTNTQEESGTAREASGADSGSEAPPFGAADGVQPAPPPLSPVEIMSPSAGDALAYAFMDQALNPPDNLRQGDIVVSLDEQIAALSPEVRNHVALQALALLSGGLPVFAPGQKLEFTAGAGVGVQLNPGAVLPAIDTSPRQEFEVISPVQLDGVHYDIGDPIFLTRSGHVELKLAGAVSGEWDERDE